MGLKTNNFKTIGCFFVIIIAVVFVLIVVIVDIVLLLLFLGKSSLLLQGDDFISQSSFQYSVHFVLH